MARHSNKTLIDKIDDAFKDQPHILLGDLAEKIETTRYTAKHNFYRLNATGGNKALAKKIHTVSSYVSMLRKELKTETNSVRLEKLNSRLIKRKAELEALRSLARKEKELAQAIAPIPKLPVSATLAEIADLEARVKALKAGVKDQRLDGRIIKAFD